ncbi:dihydropteroate synthase [Naasia sp. SYSU D00948]|uniref:dihydropteroate synthase n=1 Tax=Naasia sp. SYSU D00948 TaxID=2817379 RepID=UPI001B3009B2|nr:dihydropteroate synthase [Naasia sp. SYSU D00948]
MPERPLVFGILNVTPDSFSDGGRFADPDAAVRQGLRLVADGADWVDIGGESTRPGAGRVAAEEEQRRVLPVVAALAEQGVRVSIDTMNADTARAALAAGAGIVNDVSGGLADPAMPEVVASARVPFVVMHWRGHSAAMSARAVYDDVVLEVRDELAARVQALIDQGIAADRIVLDPGIGFAKESEHNWRVLAGLGALQELGHPLLVGVSRKRFLGGLPSLSGAEDPAARDLPTAVTSALLALQGVWAVRVHDVAGTAAALDVVDAWRGVPA